MEFQSYAGMTHTTHVMTHSCTLTSPFRVSSSAPKALRTPDTHLRFDFLLPHKPGRQGLPRVILPDASGALRRMARV